MFYTLSLALFSNMRLINFYFRHLEAEENENAIIPETQKVLLLIFYVKIKSIFVNYVYYKMNVK